MTDHLARPSDHTPEAVRRRLAGDNVPSYLRDFVYGAIDGCVTTFAIVAGVVGAGRSPSLVVILGFANLLADGFSMAIGNFLGTKADQQVADRVRRIEETHVDTVPEGEREEIREIFRQKGFEGELLERVVEVITADRRLWIETMLVEEWGLSPTRVSPVRAALVTFVAFVTVGFVPIMPYVAARIAMPGVESGTFTVSAWATAIVFFAVGALKSRVTDTRWWRCGLETLAMGGVAAVVAYAVGAFLQHLG